ncbi:unnamed protein product [Vitrella brassicaformis CCMP3155]|uniref:very-long-chain (3R)-3-hydroxyacyl-CoA dehydratase n=1 Tax=Vitrella brassicaformis (strain CCMP3155) TaxID=1169540 RepID=A0A0G4EYA1_VITBC|nr:unnamed protein product [Vitrella brassicaformis CCMP3155]|eukprot:CEM03420.1 unnamed protein product [Vitrella brassicaformis CCMP3155]
MKAYLFAYNMAVAAAWLWVGVVCAMHLAQNGWSRIDLFWGMAEVPLKIAQTAAVLEVVHALFQLVKSPVMTTLAQVLSRLHIVWIIYQFIPSTHTYWVTLHTIAMWTLAELIRYPFYALNLYGWAPKAMLWLRYSGFLVLYPSGIAGELGSIVHALFYMSAHEEFRTFPEPMPNRFNFTIDLWLAYVAMLLTYVPGTVILFSHMLTQRKKYLASTKDRDRSSKGE